ncbi:hypothetical protein PUT24_32380, partial [Streptomyces sp. SP17KL33]|nr:hypothetical protein [Streptomyces sp. SP17KL33]
MFTRALPRTTGTVHLLLFQAGPIAYSANIAYTDHQLTGKPEHSYKSYEKNRTKKVKNENISTAFGHEQFHNAVWLTKVYTVVSALLGQNTLRLERAALMQRASK